MKTAPPSAEQNPLSAYTPIRVCATGSPISNAERGLPPTAYTLRPKRVKCATKIAATSVTSAINTLALTEPVPIGRRYDEMALKVGSVIVIDCVVIRKHSPRAKNIPASVTMNGCKRKK